MKTLDDLRKKIDAIDTELLKTMAKRMSVVREIGKIKKEQNLPPLDEKRWKEVIMGRQEMAKKLKLPKAFIAAIWHTIHKEALRIEEEL